MPTAREEASELRSNAAPGRDVSIDVARGIAIVAIVLGHVLRGVGGTGLIDPDSVLAAVLDRSLYLFHLAVFAFLSGLFVARTVERRGGRSFLRHRVLTFAYLYLVWSLLQGAVKLATGSMVNEPTDIRDVLNLVVPEGQLWFLPWLIIASVLSLLIRPWRSRRRAIITLAVSAVVAVVAWGSDFGYIGTQGLALYVFYFAGQHVGAARFSATISSTSAAVLGVLAVGGTAMLLTIGIGTEATIPTSYFAVRTPLTILLGIVGAIAGVIAVLAVAGLLARVPRIANPIAFIGRYSLEIFLAHIIFAAGARIIMSKLGIDSATVVVLGALVVGVAAPIVLAVVTRRIRAPWLFEMPGEQPRRPKVLVPEGRGADS